MAFGFLMVWSIAGVVIGRFLMKRWFNHLSIYSGMWGLSLLAYELRWIRYNPISGLAWFYIFVAWIAFFIGGVVYFLLKGRPGPEGTKATPAYDGMTTRLKTVLWILCLLAAVSLWVQAHQIIGEFGSLMDGLLLNANALYGMRMDAELGGIPYFLYLAYAACALAGAYTALVGRFSVVGLLPMATMAVSAIFSMQRSGLAIAGTLFFTAFVFCPRPHGFKMKKSQVVCGLLAGILLVPTVFVLISLHRGQYTYYPGETATLNKLSEYVPGIKSQYVYLSVPGPGLSEYFKRPKDDDAFFGRYTFAPIFRQLAKVGFPTQVPYYEEYYFTPAETNQATYLKNLYSDFGPLGVLIGPFLLGAIGTLLVLRTLHRFRLATLMLLCHVYVVIMFSFSGYYVLTGYWFVSLVASYLVARFVERVPATRTATRSDYGYAGAS